MEEADNFDYCSKGFFRIRPAFFIIDSNFESLSGLGVGIAAEVDLVRLALEYEVALCFEFAGDDCLRGVT